MRLIIVSTVLKIQFVDIYLCDLGSVQADRRIVAVIICNKEAVFRFNDRRVTIAVFHIAFQQSAFLRKRIGVVVTKRGICICE